MRVILLFQLVQVVELGFVEPLEHGTLIRRSRAIACQLVKVERIELELDGVADGLEAHRIAELAVLDYLQIAAAHEAFSIRHGEAAGELEAALAPPGVAHLRAADLVVFDDGSAFRTGRRHIRRSPAPARSGR